MKLFLDETLGRSADVILEPDNLGVYTLNQNNWKRMHKAMGVNTVIVKFYDPLCKQSIEFKQTYEDLGKLSRNFQVLHVTELYGRLSMQTTTF